MHVAGSSVPSAQSFWPSQYLSPGTHFLSDTQETNEEGHAVVAGKEKRELSYQMSQKAEWCCKRTKLISIEASLVREVLIVYLAS